MRLFTRMAYAAVIGAMALMPFAASAQTAAETANSIEAVGVAKQGNGIVVKITLKKAIQSVPGSFSVANPARIAIDFPATINGTGKGSQVFNEGDLRSANIVQAGDRTRLVLNLQRPLAYETRIEDKNVVVTLAGSAAASVAPQTAKFAEATPASSGHAIRDINFRRGKDGEARVIVDLSDPGVGIDIQQQGNNLVVDFARASLPEQLRKRLDVTDFATPVTSITSTPQGSGVRMVIAPKGLWEHNAYQSDNQFVVEVKQVQEDPRKLVQGAGRQKYAGDKLSLNFQNIDVRSVLQVIADFTNFNIITSDSVTGNLTLRLKDVPWDQALDIILQAKGLDMRKNGNVIWIAPRDELATRERLEFEARQQITDLEPLRTESFQINYHKATSVAAFLRNRDQTILSKRGSVVVDERTNKLFVSDIGSRLDDIRRVVSEIDVPVRQVLIEAQIVEAADTFTRNLGVRLGFGGSAGGVVGTTTDGRSVGRNNFGAGIGQTTYQAGLVETKPNLYTDGLAVNLPAGAIAAKAAGALSFVLWNSNATRFLALEISALEADGKGKVISRPRVMTADQVEAIIEQGVEIPYQQATSSGATSVSFRKANLALKVKPQITPDGKIMMSLDVNKDTPNTKISTSSGIAIDTKHVKTEVLVENGGTVVIGGIYTQETTNQTTKIPFLGDLPVAGYLFRDNARVDDKTELLVFITPRIVSDQSAAR
ncbi:type 4a pilus secretin PilQ [Niveibacterium umoris]|uniref:Type IV pilus assembly protein PilQ n=1 Tax=Niveibacterium umoris TaxID=1193620 RepID=A0A840BP90_9RHOO|nr:type IV pilus secretin PilQ [Niveibacterium umoris]MBB4013338.1 type IV pilus assembly protein PilQ [Niveibacterium umoris]